MVPPRDFVRGSRFLSWAGRCARHVRMLLGACGAWTMRQTVWRALVRTWRMAPLRAGGLLLATAVLANGACLWWWGKPIDGWWLAQRLWLLMLGLLAASCTSGWHATVRGSRFIRLFRRIVRPR